MTLDELMNMKDKLVDVRSKLLDARISFDPSGGGVHAHNILRQFESVYRVEVLSHRILC